MIGLDPDDILVNPCPLCSDPKPHRATVARCSCGVIGCGSIEVEVTRSQEIVDWTWSSPDSRKAMGFFAANYDAELERALLDRTWETPDRTAARLLAAKVDPQGLASHGFTYSWASGRVRKGTLSLDYPRRTWPGARRCGKMKPKPQSPR